MNLVSYYPFVSSNSIEEADLPPFLLHHKKMKPRQTSPLILPSLAPSSISQVKVHPLELDLKSVGFESGDIPRVGISRFRGSE